MKAKYAGVKIVGDVDFRGACPLEGAEHRTLFNWLRREYPDCLGRLAIHPKGEGKRTKRRVMLDKADGTINTGASDVVIPTSPSIVIELKRQDRTKSKVSEDQLDYLRAVTATGGHACIALGWEAAVKFIEEVYDK